MKDLTCFKNSSCLDLILTNSLYSLQNFCVIETGLSDFHKLIVSIMGTTFQYWNLQLFTIEIILDSQLKITEKKFLQNLSSEKKMLMRQKQTYPSKHSS